MSLTYLLYRADVTCEDCLTFGTAMQNYLMSDASIAEQVNIYITFKTITALLKCALSLALICTKKCKLGIEYSALVAH